MNYNVFQVYNLDLPKIRLGRNNDGGYVIHDHILYDNLIGCGVGNDLSFELALLNNNTEIKTCLLFDGTIDRLPYDNKKFKFIKKNIGNTNNKYLTNLQEELESPNIFLKMDIEGSEYDWLDTASLKNVSQFVVEFHSVSDIIEKYNTLFEKVNKTHYLTHVHINNHVDLKDGKPQVIECTYVNKNITGVLQLVEYHIPTKLDQPNKINKKDIVIKNWPHSVCDT